MQVTSTQRFLDENGNPIEEYELANSRYTTVGVRKLGDRVEVRALEAGTGDVTEVSVSLLKEGFKAGALDGDARPRDLDEDLRTALQLQRIALVDTEVIGA